MRDAGLVGASHRHGGPRTTRRNKDDRPAPDPVDRDFSAAGPNHRTEPAVGGRPHPGFRRGRLYVPTLAGFLYLAVVLWLSCSGCRARRLEPQDRRAGDGKPPARRAGSGCAGDGGWPASAQRRHPPQRPKPAPAQAGGTNIPRRRSASAAARPVFDPQWARSVRPEPVLGPAKPDPGDNALCESFFSTREAELLSRRRLASQVRIPGSHPRPRQRWPASATSRVGPIRCGCIRAWDIARQYPTKPTGRPP
jgi:putative transposase